MCIKNIVIVFLVLLCCCKSNLESSTELLASKHYACWDAKRGFGMCFCRDGKLYEYEFADQAKNKRVKADYGDFILSELQWKIKGDSLIIFSASFKEGYKIKALNNRQLVLLDAKQTRGAEELVYTKVDTFVPIDSLKQSGADYSQ